MNNTFLSNKIYVTFFVLFALASCNSSKQKNESISLSFELELGVDKGQSVGTIFQIKDNNQVLCAAGFQNSYETYVGNNNRTLSFFIKSNEPYKNEKIVNPFPNVHRKTRLFTLGNKLYAKSIELKSPFKFYNEALKKWEIDTAMNHKLGNQFKDFQLVNNELLLFNQYNIVYKNDTIYNVPPNTSFLTALYRNGKFLLFNLGSNGEPNTICLADWQVGWDTVHISASFTDPCIDQPSNYPYCMLDYQSGFLVGTNYGMVYYIDSSGLDVIFERKPNKESWQPYCMISYYNDILIGQYPTGSMFVYNNSGLEAFKPSVLPCFGVSHNSREAQSVTFYGGDILLGVWPWGELRRFSDGNKKWDIVARLYEYPNNLKIIEDDYDAPYVDLFKSERNEVYNNTWGQRITGFATLGESIYASTSNKGWVTPAEDSLLLGSKVVEQYGVIHKITKPSQIAVAINWKPKTTIELVYENDTIKIVQDGKRLISHKLSNHRIKSMTTDQVNVYLSKKITIGEGIYGRYGGIEIRQIK